MNIPPPEDKKCGRSAGELLHQDGDGEHALLLGGDLRHLYLAHHRQPDRHHGQASARPVIHLPRDEGARAGKEGFLANILTERTNCCCTCIGNRTYQLDRYRDVQYNKRTRLSVD